MPDLLEAACNHMDAVTVRHASWPDALNFALYAAREI
jgi:hypothetical protein